MTYFVFPSRILDVSIGFCCGAWHESPSGASGYAFHSLFRPSFLEIIKIVFRHALSVLLVQCRDVLCSTPDRLMCSNLALPCHFGL